MTDILARLLPRLLHIAPFRAFSGGIGINDARGTEVARTRHRRDIHCLDLADRLVTSYNACHQLHIEALKTADMLALLQRCEAVLAGFEEDTDDGNAEEVAPILRVLRALLKEDPTHV